MCKGKMYFVFTFISSALCGVLLIYYGIYVFVPSPRIYLTIPDEPVHCYEDGMKAYNAALSSRPMREDGTLAPRLFFHRERKALRLLLHDIEKNGINTEECTFFIVGPVYGLYETMGLWVQAKEFLQSAKKFYAENSYEYNLIVTLINNAEIEIDKPFYRRGSYSVLAVANSFIKWNSSILFYVFLVLSILSLILGCMTFLNRNKLRISDIKDV